MLIDLNRVQSVTIVNRRSGPGYRVVLCRRAPGGTPVLETLTESFSTVDGAQRFVLDRFGMDPAQVRTKVRSPA